MNDVAQVIEDRPWWRVGFVVNEKMTKKFRQPEFKQVCRLNGVEPIEIDIQRPLEEQGPFHVIVHKLLDHLAMAKLRRLRASVAIINAFETYMKNHPETIILDDFKKLYCLFHRYETYKIIAKSELVKEGVLLVPSFVQLNSRDAKENLSKLKEAGVAFPIVCKPIFAYGSQLAHQMSLIFNEEGLADVNPPCVAQSFLNHGAVLYKLFVIGEKWFIVKRPSVKNFYDLDHKTIVFTTHAVSKANSDCYLNKLDENDQGTVNIEPDKNIMEQIVETVSKVFNMGLFGVDVMIDINTGKYAIIDVNDLPGYDGVNEFFPVIIEYIISQIHRFRAMQQIPLENLSISVKEQTEMAKAEDSGTDTGYSSDEKKTLMKLAASQRIPVKRNMIHTRIAVANSKTN